MVYGTSALKWCVVAARSGDHASGYPLGQRPAGVLPPLRTPSFKYGAGYGFRVSESGHEALRPRARGLGQCSGPGMGSRAADAIQMASFTRLQDLCS